MTDGMASNFVSVSVQILNLCVVCPFVRHIEGRLDWAAIRVEPSPEEILIELLVQVVDSIVEGEEDKLRNLVRRQTSGDFLATTVAVRNLAEGRVTIL